MNREEYIYYCFMKKATEDGYISLDESGLILILEDRLGLSDDSMDNVMTLVEEGGEPDLTPEELDTIKNDMSNHIYEVVTYKEVLKEAVTDESIKKDEFDLLETLRTISSVEQEERMKIYEQVKEEIRHDMEQDLKPNIVDRIKTLMGLEK